jgi:hypothetical protein
MCNDMTFDDEWLTLWADKDEAKRVGHSLGIALSLVLVTQKDVAGLGRR